MELATQNQRRLGSKIIRSVCIDGLEVYMDRIWKKLRLKIIMIRRATQSQKTNIRYFLIIQHTKKKRILRSTKA